MAKEFNGLTIVEPPTTQRDYWDVDFFETTKTVRFHPPAYIQRYEAVKKVLCEDPRCKFKIKKVIYFFVPIFIHFTTKLIRYFLPIDC